MMPFYEFEVDSDHPDYGIGLVLRIGEAGATKIAILRHQLLTVFGPNGSTWEEVWVPWSEV